MQVRDASLVTQAVAQIPLALLTVMGLTVSPTVPGATHPLAGRPPGVGPECQHSGNVPCLGTSLPSASTTLPSTVTSLLHLVKWTPVATTSKQTQASTAPPLLPEGGSSDMEGQFNPSPRSHRQDWALDPTP